VSHRLVERGLTRREAVLSLYLISGALGMAAVLITRTSALEAYAVGGVIAVIALYMLWKLEWRRQPKTESTIEAKTNTILPS
jgi:UDP-GlcNAc:undecaprenyl-phosphate GlcNAc-1-phosphate transferase